MSRCWSTGPRVPCLARLVAVGVLLRLGACAGSTPPPSEPTQTSPQSVVLRYEDFGTAVHAHELLGDDWWQWQPHGDSRPRHYDIHVVVYCNQELAEVAEHYPVVPEEEQDYRYVEYDDAMRYLRDTIAVIKEEAFPGDDVDWFTRELRETLRTLPDKLPACSSQSSGSNRGPPDQN